MIGRDADNGGVVDVRSGSRQQLTGPFMCPTPVSRTRNVCRELAVWAGANILEQAAVPGLHCHHANHRVLLARILSPLRPNTCSRRRAAAPLSAGECAEGDDSPTGWRQGRKASSLLSNASQIHASPATGVRPDSCPFLVASQKKPICRAYRRPPITNLIGHGPRLPFRRAARQTRQFPPGAPAIGRRLKNSCSYWPGPSANFGPTPLPVRSVRTRSRRAIRSSHPSKGATGSSFASSRAN